MERAILAKKKGAPPDETEAGVEAGEDLEEEENEVDEEQE